MKYFEVFKAGNYPQGKFTKEEVQELAKNYDPSFCEAPITLDHEQKGPAYGCSIYLYNSRQYNSQCRK